MVLNYFTNDNFRDRFVDSIEKLKRLNFLLVWEKKNICKIFSIEFKNATSRTKTSS